MFRFVVFKISVTIYILRQFSFHRDGRRPIETTIYNIPIIERGKNIGEHFSTLFSFDLLFNNKYIS